MSSSKRILTPIQVITSGVMTGTNVLASSAIDVSYLSRVSIQFVWTGTPNGTFDIQGSLDNTTFTSIATNPASITAVGAAGNHMIEGNVSFKYLKVQYTNASSTGTLQAYVMGKED